ncbi:MAG: metallophosphoesterase [Elainellaceae cyanobacterium]
MSFRVNPYLQQPSSNGMYITWFSETDASGDVSISGPGLDTPLTFSTEPTFEPLLSYTDAELNQEITGLEQGSWLLGNDNYKHTVDVSGLLPDSTYTYTVTVDGQVFESSFTTAPTADDWEHIRFVALSDSETEPLGRVRRRDWQQGALDADSLPRPSADGSLWAETLGVSGDRLNYPLTEATGYLNNLEIINSRNPDFLVMPGDLIQGGGYQPAWDEFFRHNAGEFDSGLSEYPILPALGNWENFGALNGGYGTDADGRFGPLVGRQKFGVYFDAPENGTPEHQDNYYRIDYGPVTILTLDSSNGEPDDSRGNYGGEGQPPQISGQEFTGPGTDTQENFTREQYEAEGGTDLADFNPGSTQWNWVIEQLEDARADGQMIFAQFHHVPYSSGTHGLPMNHEDSSGQGGTPLRQYHPLFEEYGVVAVFSGHSEMFERSFVDEDGDGTGVFYYDVGVAGDGMRGQRTDADGNLLNYNAFSQWTADQDEPELWAEVDGVLQNVAGGKHYGHLEVNVQRLDGEDGVAQVTFTPVYSFPILDSNYELVDTERRVYGDEITLQINADGIATSPVPEEFLVESGVTSVFLDLDLIESATGLVLTGVDSEAAPFSEDFQVGFAINDETDLSFTAEPFAPAGGTIEHDGTITFNDAITVGNFSIGFDAGRVSGAASGFFVADTVEGNDLDILFDIGAPGVVETTDAELTIAEADLLLAPEFAEALGLSDLTGADVGDARVDALLEDEAVTIDFEGEGLESGSVVTDQLTGLTVATSGPEAMIFDTANPTGGDDDLASDILGNILILSEDGDSTDPDDNANGGTFEFTFDELVTLESIGVFDIERVGTIIAYDEAGSVLGVLETTVTGGNQAGTVEIGLDGVSRVDVTLVESGAITDLVYTAV